MSHGGKRPGAGRRHGSRDKGKAAIEALQAVNGELPMQLWARVMSDPSADLQLRLAVAKEMAPYVHAKLSSTELKATIQSQTEFWSKPENAALLNGYAGRTSEN